MPSKGEQNLLMSTDESPAKWVSGTSYAGSLPPVSASTFTITTLFQIMTACGLFFACLRVSPILAITLTVLIAPAVIRTGFISDIHRQCRMEFGLVSRLKYFVSSLAIVIVASVIAGLVFLVISLIFSAIGLAFGIAMGGSTNLRTDAAVVGAAGGMIWGFAGGILALAYSLMRVWIPRSLVEKCA